MEVEVEVGSGGERRTMRFLISRGVAVLVIDFHLIGRPPLATLVQGSRFLSYLTYFLTDYYLYQRAQTANNIDLSLFVRFLFPSVSIGTARSLFIHHFLILASGLLVISSHLPLCSGTAGQ